MCLETCFLTAKQQRGLYWHLIDHVVCMVKNVILVYTEQQEYYDL